MGILFLTLILGIILGRLLRRQQSNRPLHYLPVVTLWALYGFLVLVGIGIGANPTIMQNIPVLGVKAMLLGLAAMGGSILLSPLARRLVMGSEVVRCPLLPTRPSPARDQLPFPPPTMLADEIQRLKRRQLLLNSAVNFAFFCMGVVLGAVGFVCDDIGCIRAHTFHALCLLLTLVGIGIGSDPRCVGICKKRGLALICVPLITVAGTLLGTALLSFILHDITAKQAMGVGAGLGYYSLSSVMLTQLASPTIGAMALLANLFRELVTISCGPWIIRYFGPFGLIASGASSSASVALPAISTFAGNEFVIIAVVSGIFLQFCVPLLITLIVALL